MQAHYIGIITPNILILLQMSIVIAMAVIARRRTKVASLEQRQAMHAHLELLELVGRDWIPIRQRIPGHVSGVAMAG